MIITIDGPSGVGKSTVARSAARRLGFLYLDTGSMYRAVALRVAVKGIDPDDVEALSGILDDTTIDFRKNPDGDLLLLLNGEDVSKRIRTPEISLLSSDVATKSAVRKKLTDIQRRVGSEGNVVAEGRDMGTYVFPEAEYKFFLTASPEVRAKRRCVQLGGAGSEVDLKLIEKDILLRDKQDSERAESPLHPSANAVIIDTTNLLADEVTNRIISIVQG